ncbi:hypothetical protein LINPERHAP1_LOCUS13327 [Linum perenne]
MTAAAALRSTPSSSTLSFSRGKAGDGKCHMQAKRKPAKSRWRADRRRQPLGSKIRGRVPKGNGSIAARRPPAQSRSPTTTRFQARLNRLPLQEGKVKERDKDEEEKGGRRRKKKKVEEGRRKERAGVFFFFLV